MLIPDCSNGFCFRAKVVKMVYNENLNVRTIEEVNLYEPRIAKVRIRSLCYPIGLLFIIDDLVHLYLTYINYYGREGSYNLH